MKKKRILALLLAAMMIFGAVSALAEDIGDTLVGMHVRPVAVPFRGDYAQLGQAHLVMAYSRLPLIGGERAVYP